MNAITNYKSSSYEESGTDDQNHVRSNYNRLKALFFESRFSDDIQQVKNINHIISCKEFIDDGELQVRILDYAAMWQRTEILVSLLRYPFKSDPVKNDQIQPNMERHTVKGMACIHFIGRENDLNVINTFLESCHYMTQDLIGIYERACQTGKIDIIRRMQEFPEMCQHIELNCEKAFFGDFLYTVSVRVLEYLLTIPSYQKFLYRGVRCDVDDVLSPYRSGEMLKFLAKTDIVQGYLRNLEGFNLQHTELNPLLQKDIQVVHTDGNFIFNLLPLDVLVIVVSNLSKKDIVALRGTFKVLRKKVDHPKIDVLALQNDALWQDRLNRLHIMDNTIPTIIPQTQNPKIWILKTFVDGCEKIFEKHRTLFQKLRHKLDKKEPFRGGQALSFGRELDDPKKYQKNRYIRLIRPYKSLQDLEIQNRFLCNHQIETEEKRQAL